MNLFLLYVGLNITKKFIPKIFLDFIDDLKEHRDIGVIDVEIQVDNEFKDHTSIVKIFHEQKKKSDGENGERERERERERSNIYN